MRLVPVIALVLVSAPAWSQSAWPTHHRDFRNSDYTPFPATPHLEVAWSALDGRAILTAPTIGPDGTLYVTTGTERGGNLHALSRYGRLLWSHPDIDAKAITSSPVIGNDGVIYLTDRDQLWAVHPDGTTRWEIPVPQAFGTALLLGTNGVGGITLDGQALLFDRKTGMALAPPFQLPGAVPPPPDNLPEVFGTLIDPAIARTVVAGLLGFGSLVNNTPAVHPDGRLVVIVTGDGYLHGLTMEPGAITPRFRVAIGPNSGSSPAISPDGGTIYVSDGEGFLQSHATQDGSLRFRIFTGRTFASPSVDEHGTVYAGGDGAVVALRDGRIVWRTDLAPLAARVTSPVRINGAWLAPRLQPVSVLTITPRHILFQADAGPPVELGNGTTLVAPRWTGLIALDRATGRLAAPPLSLRDTGGAVVTVNADGRVYAPHAAITTALAAYFLNPSLPAGLRFRAPVGGLTALRPADPRALLREQAMLAAAWSRTGNDNLPVLLNGMRFTLVDATAKGQVNALEAFRGYAGLTRWLGRANGR